MVRTEIHSQTPLRGPICYISLSNQLVVYSLLPAMSSAQMYRERLNVFIGEQTLLGKFIGGICST